MDSRKYEVAATASFASDLDAAVGYYLEQSGPKSAGRFLASYESFARLLSNVPGHGTPIEGAQLRWRKVGVFIAVYEVDDEAMAVSLLRLYYISSDWHPLAKGLGA